MNPGPKGSEAGYYERIRCFNLASGPPPAGFLKDASPLMIRRPAGEAVSFVRFFDVLRCAPDWLRSDELQLGS